MIVVTFALPEESRNFVATWGNRRLLSGGTLPVVSGTLGSTEIVVVHTGVGLELAARATEAILTRHRPRCLISAGFAGGLDPVLRSGELLLAVNFSDGHLLETIRDTYVEGEVCRCGTLTSCAHPIETVDEKAALFRQTNASAVDMETDAIHTICERLGVPMLSLRVISDSALESLPVSFPIWFDTNTQQPRRVALLAHLARHPGKIPGFIRFVRNTLRAQRRLGNQLTRVVSGLAAPTAL